jgi:hypothetical protein
MLTGNGIGQASSALKMLDRLLYRRPGGKQYRRSTRQTNKKAALEIAHLWERPFHHRLQHDQARRVFAESFQAACGETLSHSSTRDFLTAWLGRKNI